MRWVELTASVRLTVPVRAGSVQWVALCVRPADANYFVPLPMTASCVQTDFKLWVQLRCALDRSA